MNPLNAEMYRRLYDAYTNKKRCTYCGESGHSIRRCQHPSIHALRYHIFFTLVQCSPQEQREYLESISLSTVKMICVLMNKSLHATRGDSIQEIQTELISMSEIIEILPMLRVPKKIIINTISLEPQEKDMEKECPICLESKTIKDTFLTNCNHTFCISCMHQHLKTSSKTNCPMCRENLAELISKQKMTRQNRHIIGKQEYQIR